MRRKPFVCCLVLLVAIAAFAVVDVLEPFNDKVFEHQVWIQGGSERIPMARNVINRVVRAGMTRSEVTDILGPEEYIEEGQDSGGNIMRGAKSLAYPLGSSSATSLKGMDNAFIYIHLDDEGNVIGQEIAGY